MGDSQEVVVAICLRHADQSFGLDGIRLPFLDGTIAAARYGLPSRTIVLAGRP